MRFYLLNSELLGSADSAAMASMQFWSKEDDRPGNSTKVCSSVAKLEWPDASVKTNWARWWCWFATSELSWSFEATLSNSATTSTAKSRLPSSSSDSPAVIDTASGPLANWVQLLSGKAGKSGSATASSSLLPSAEIWLRGKSVASLLSLDKQKLS